MQNREAFWLGGRSDNVDVEKPLFIFQCTTSSRFGVMCILSGVIARQALAVAVVAKAATVLPHHQSPNSFLLYVYIMGFLADPRW